MRVRRRELVLWSFLMSSAHGAGLMVAPLLIAGAATGAHQHDLFPPETWICQRRRCW